MAEKKPINQIDAPVIGADKMVDLYIPKIRGQKEQLDVIIGINGKNYQIKRGESVKVPKRVADEYYRSVKSRDAADEYLFNTSK